MVEQKSPEKHQNNPPKEIPLGADVLYKLSAELVAHLDEKAICERVAYRLSATLGYDFVAIFLIDENTKIRHLAASAGFENPATPLYPGQGISERPILNGKLQYTPDVSQDEHYFYGAGGSEVDVPIWVDDKVVGVIIAESSRTDAFSKVDFDLLTAVSQITGLTLEKARLFGREHKRIKTLEALSLTMTELTAVRDLKKLLKTILVRAIDLIGATGGQLGMYEPEANQLRIVVSHNLKRNYVGATQKIGQGMMGMVASSKQSMMIDDYMTWPGRLESYTSHEEIHSSIAVPLMIEEQLLGVFTTITSEVHRKFDQDDLNILHLFAQQAALAVDFTSLYEKSRYENQERRRLYDQVVRQKEYYESLLIYSPSAIVTGDLEGNIISWNPMAEKLFGYRFEEVVGKPLNEFVANHPDLMEEAEKFTTDVFTDGRVVTTTQRTRKDGAFVDVELLALPIKVFGEIIGFIALYHDLTELKAIERALRIKNELMSRQLILAGEIQTSFLPKTLPECEGWQISAKLKPALETSGDFYDIRVLPNGNIIFLIADVIDKGVGAALFMSLCWSLLRLFGNSYPNQPASLFEKINRYILTETRIEQFVTVFYGVLNPQSGEMVFSNAGHCPMYLLRQDATKKVERWKAQGIPLGIELNHEWQENRIHLNPGDMFILYTDGIIEAEGPSGEFFGEKNLLNCLMSSKTGSASETAERILQTLNKFMGKRSKQDDIALIAVKREPN